MELISSYYSSSSRMVKYPEVGFCYFLCRYFLFEFCPSDFRKRSAIKYHKIKIHTKNNPIGSVLLRLFLCLRGGWGRWKWACFLFTYFVRKLLPPWDRTGQDGWHKDRHLLYNMKKHHKSVFLYDTACSSLYCHGDHVSKHFSVF